MPLVACGALFSQPDPQGSAVRALTGDAPSRSRVVAQIAMPDAIVHPTLFRETAFADVPMKPPVFRGA